MLSIWTIPKFCRLVKSKSLPHDNIYGNQLPDNKILVGSN